MVERAFRAMGCDVAVFLDADGSAARRVLDAVPHHFERIENCLSRFREHSELSRVNHRRTQRVFVSAMFAEVLHEALRLADWTDGLVTPTVLPALLAAGYDRSFEHIAGEGGRPPKATLPLPQVAMPEHGAGDWRDIVLDVADNTLIAPEAIQFDFGGVGKAWAAQRVLQTICHLGPALVNAGGDIACSGPQRDGAPWPVAVAASAPGNASIATLALGGCGVATSGRDFRTWTRHGVVKHHIIDPRTGVPAESDMMSATVIAQNVLVADAAAKVLMILGSDQALRWLATHPEVDAILQLADGRVLQSARARDFIWGGVPA